MRKIPVLFALACAAFVAGAADDAAARGERLRALIAEKTPRLRDYEKAAYVAALDEGGESVDWALRNLAASNGPVEPKPQTGKWWMPRHEERLRQIRESGGRFDLVFFGDSISHHWESAGKEVLAEIRRTHSVLVDGFSGDRTYNALWRARHGELDGFVARVITLLIGTNNWADNTVEETAADIRELVGVIREKQPQARILLVPILPRSDARSDFKNRKADEINARIESLADGKSVVWFDLRKTFAGAPKTLMPDGLHPGAEGYVRWWAALKPHLQDACGAAEVPEAFPNDAIRDFSAFTVKARVRIDRAKMPEKASFQFLRQAVSKTGWALELKNYGTRGTMVQLGCNGAWFTAGWIKPSAGAEHEIVLTARKGLLVVYCDGEILRRFHDLVTPNLEPVRVWKKGGVEVLSVEFLGADTPYYAKGETDAPAEGFVGGVGWLVSCPPEQPGVELPRILCFGDSILSGYTRHLRRELEGKAYVYTWGWFVYDPLGDRLPTEKFVAAAKVRKFDYIVFNNGLHSLHWTPEKVSDELLMQTQRAILNAFRKGAPQAKMIWMSTTPHTSRKLNAAHKVEALGELNPMVERINRLTGRVMAEERVPTIDAYGLLVRHLDLASGDAYHWTGEGYTLLARLMAQEIFKR